jgi:hypothetical protein
LETQTDYEAVVLLAAFRSVESAQAAEKALQAAGIEYKQRPLQPSRYQVADPRLRNYTRIIVGAAIAGALVGALSGIVIALLLAYAQWPAPFFFAVAGAGGGAVIGSLIGLTVRAQYDDDVARTIVVEAGLPGCTDQHLPESDQSEPRQGTHNSRTGGCDCLSGWFKLRGWRAPGWRSAARLALHVLIEAASARPRRLTQIEKKAASLRWSARSAP